MPTLPRVQVFAVFAVGQPIIVNDNLRTGSDREVIHQRAQRCVRHVGDVSEDVRKAVTHRRAGDLLEARDEVRMPLARARRHLDLNDMRADKPRLYHVVAQWVRDQIRVHALLQQLQALHVPIEFEARNQPAPIIHRVFAVLLVGALGVGLVPIIIKAAVAVL